MARVLLADDSKVMLLGLSEFVTKLNHEVVTANDGREALNKFIEEQGKFDLVVTDINMPNMNGLELASGIRTGEHNKDVPIIVLSSEEGDKIKAEGKNIGVSAWIVKPPREEIFQKAIQHFLD